MNATPRTDAAYSIYDLRKVAQDIEHELNAANERIKRLEDIISRARNKFFRHGSNGTAASGMLDILGEARKP